LIQYTSSYPETGAALAHSGTRSLVLC